MGLLLLYILMGTVSLAAGIAIYDTTYIQPFIYSSQWLGSSEKVICDRTEQNRKRKHSNLLQLNCINGFDFVVLFGCYIEQNRTERI